MMWLITISVFALWLQCSAAQSGLGNLWQANQINATWCQWDSPRAAVIRDTLYVDGGSLRVYPGLSDGSYGELLDNGNPYGLVYKLNFSKPFNTSANFSEIMTSMTKAGNGLANNIAPNFYDGAMLANNEQWFTYGGQIVTTDAFSSPDADWVAKYMQYRSGPERVFEPGWQIEELSANVTRYVTAGAAVSVPSENLGYYFGGLRAADFGAIDILPGNASTLSMTMIEVNMATQNSETWRNLTIPAIVGGRANAELVWIPVAEKGVLIAIGGVINPSFATIAQRLNTSQTAESQRVSPGFMKSVAVYDIANERWYKQDTSGNIPPQLTQGCTVVASAQDGSSHNIYWYGGYDGITLTSSDNFNDDVWVLSVPSFTWTKLASGDFKHARARHRCVKPYPDQMMVVGGFSAPVGEAPKCVDGGIVQMFNLSSGKWTNSYDPTIWTEYTVPSIISEKIGGNGLGGATVYRPSNGWSNNTLGDLFGQKYDAGKIKKWYPFKKAEEKNTTQPLPIPQPTGSSTPSYLAPVLGVVLGLFFITLVILAILLWRRRKLLRSRATQSESGTIEHQRWIDNWLLGTAHAPMTEQKAPTVTTDDAPSSGYEDESRSYVRPNVSEMGDGQVHEMMDTSRPVELHDTGFVPLHESSRKNGHLHPSPSIGSQYSRTSSVSHISSSSNQQTRPGISPLNSPDFSPTHSHDGSQSPEQSNRIVSGVSNISETDRGHMRGISETSVSTVGAYATPMDGLDPRRESATAISPFGPDSYHEIRERQRSVESVVSPRTDGGRPSLVSPMSPPEGHDGNDYIGAGTPPQTQEPLLGRSPSVSGAGSVQRKSNFQERLD